MIHLERRGGRGVKHGVHSPSAMRFVADAHAGHALLEAFAEVMDGGLSRQKARARRRNEVGATGTPNTTPTKPPL
jgi:hypothetical protein